MACPTIGTAGAWLSRWDEPDVFAGWPPRRPRSREGVPDGGSVIARTIRLLRWALRGGG